MLTKEELQEAVGSNWEVTEVFAASFELSMKEVPPEKRDVLMVEVEKVRNLAYYYQEQESLPLVDGVWRAAEKLLGRKKFKALSKLYYGDARDTLTDIAVGMAILGTVQASEAGATFMSTDALRAGIVALSEAALLRAQQREDDEDLSGANRIIWECSSELGWTELLPEAFELRKLGPWESDERFIARCKMVTEKIAALFPKAE